MSDFHQIQQQFATAIRDPSQPLPAGVAQERMAVYQELFFNNVLNFVSSAFPVLCTLYVSTQWQAKVRLFFQSCHLPSPYFLAIAETFLNWLQQQPPTAEDPPFLLELAHYEWVELYLATAQRQADLPLLQQFHRHVPLAVDEMALLLSYQFPVSQISANYRPEQPAAEPSLLLVYRDLEQDIKFMALTPISATVLQLLITKPGQSLPELTSTLQTLAPQLTNEALHAGAGQLLEELAKKGVIRAFQAA